MIVHKINENQFRGVPQSLFWEQGFGKSLGFRTYTFNAPLVLEVEEVVYLFNQSHNQQWKFLQLDCV